jgi:ketosteroid isomerase-like protein
MRTFSGRRRPPAGDVDGTVAYYTGDASVFPPNAPIACDKQSIRAVRAALPASVGVSWQATRVEVARSGDLAYVQGTYQFTSKDPQAKLMDYGKFLEVWKKQADGKWKTVADIFNSNLPSAALDEVKK